MTSATAASLSALVRHSGAYTATLGEVSCREQIACFEQHLFAMPRIGPEHVAIGLGSPQLTHDRLGSWMRS